jgi:hypothetical protein
LSVSRFDFLKVRKLTVHDFLGYAFHGCSNIRVQSPALRFVEEGPERSRLAEIIVPLAMIVPIGVTGNSQRRLTIVG